MAAILQEAPVQAALQIASPMLAVGGAEGTIGAKVAPSEVPYKLVERPQELIQEGTSVLLDINGEKTSFAVVKKTLKVRVGKNLVYLEPLIGLPFGSKFEVRTGPNTADLVPVSAAKAAEAAKAREETPGTEGEEGPSGGNGKQREEMVQSLVAKVTEERALKVGASPAAVKKDNRALVDNNTAQALSKEDVEELRRQGLSGQEIIQALVANSATFSGKTEFSQEKYLKKKQKKYAPQMTVRRPSGRSVCEAYFNKNPEKTCHLRTDSLSFLLAMSNASAHHDVLVFETCGGLVTAAVAERLGGHGTLCSTYSGPRPNSIDLARMFNFDEATANSISRASMQSLVDGRSKKGENAEASGRELDEATQAGEEEGARMGADVDVATAGGEPASATGASEMDVDEKPSNSKQGPSEVDEGATDGWRNLGVGLESNEEEAKGSGLRTERNEVGVSGEGPVEAEGTGWRGLGVGDETVTGSEAGPSNRATKAAERKARRDEKRKAEGGGNKGNRLGMAASEELLQQWARQGFTSLVVAAPNFQPLAVAQVMLPLLAPSSCFAFYHTSLQPLAECMHWLQVNRKAVALQLGEPWLREYQVLPARTHPQMQMSATGGYVLSGITIVEEANPVEEENKSKEAGNKRKRGKGAPPRGGGGKRGRGR